jgi:hypothetical protein
LDKPTLRRVLEQPNNVIGTIWIGSLPGYPPFISLTLSRELDSTIIEYGEEINLPEPSPDTAVIVEGFYIIKLEHFREIIEKEGFGAIYWNECQSEGCVTIEVLDKDVVAECLGKSSRVS